MKRRNLIPETLNGIILLLSILTCLLSSCSKANKDIEGRTIQVDLTDTTYHHLLHSDGSVIVGDIIVANANGSYVAASKFCPACGTDEIRFNIGYRNNIYWVCTNCRINYYKSGWNLNYWEPGLIVLEVYEVSKSENILTIHL